MGRSTKGYAALAAKAEGEKVYAVTNVASATVQVLRRGNPEDPQESVSPSALACVKHASADFTRAQTEGERRLDLGAVTVVVLGLFFSRVATAGFSMRKLEVYLGLLLLVGIVLAVEITIQRIWPDGGRRHRALPGEVRPPRRLHRAAALGLRRGGAAK